MLRHRVSNPINNKIITFPISEESTSIIRDIKKETEQKSNDKEDNTKDIKSFCVKLLEVMQKEKTKPLRELLEEFLIKEINKY
jgi:hypothetical protein